MGIGRFKLSAKKAIVVAIIVAVVGVVAGYFLIPSEEHAQQLQAIAVSPNPAMPVGPTPEELKTKYDGEKGAGNVTFATAQAYAQSLQANSNMEGALQVWRDYVAAHGDDVQGWRALAALEQSQAHEDEYLKALENIARLDPKEESLKALSDYQNYKQKYAEQKETLKQLVALTKEQNADYLVALADVSLLVEDKEAALAAYKAYFSNEAFVAKRDNAKIEPYIRLLAQANMKDEAVAQAVALTKDAKIAVAMQQQSAAETMAVPQNVPASEGAPVPPPPMPIPSAEGAPVPPPPAPIPAAPTDAPPAPPAIVTESPEAAAVPAVPPAPPALQGAVMSPSAGVPPAPIAPPSMPVVDASVPPAPAPIQPETAPSVPSVPPATEVIPSVSVEAPAPAPVDGAAASATAVPTEMVPDLALQARIADVLLFEAGADYAVKYMEMIAGEAEMSEPMQPVYAKALVQQGEYEKALPVLKIFSVKGGDYREWYFLALSSAAKKDKSARADLVEYVKENFASGDLTEQQKMDRVYALLNAGEKPLALDYTERSMQAAPDAESRDKWHGIYKGLTAKAYSSSGKKAVKAAPRVTLEQKLQIASRQGATQDYVRRTAFEALAAGRKAEAITLFARLAAANGPDSSDAGQLNYLWGARIAGDELSWMIDIANQSEGGEQLGWIRKLSDSAAAEDVVAIGDAYPNWLQYPEFEKRYISALVQLGDTEALSKRLNAQANATQSEEAYQIVASQAGAVMDFGTQEQALRKAAEIAPNNRDNWLRLVGLYMSRARYMAAEQALQNAMNVDSNAAATDQYSAARQALTMNYYAGALSKRDGEYTIANNYFEQAANVAKLQGFDDRDSQVKLLSTQMALGDESQASQGFETLLEQSPGDAALLADYMSALLDRGSYLQALDVSSRHGGDIVLDSGVSVDDPEPVLIIAPNGEMPLIQSMSGGSELKLQFARPLPANYKVLSESGNPTWVAYTSTSYDTALIVAQSGYALQANSTPQGLMVSAVPAGKASSVEAVRQRYLRLQLLYARLELETGATDKALARLESLAPTYEEYPEYRAYQANAEYYAGNLKRGLNLVKRAQVGDPMNEDIAYLRRNIERFHAEHVKIDHEWQKLGDHRMNITTLEARKQFDNSIEVSAQIQHNLLDTDTVRRASGAIMKVDGQRWRGTFSLAKFMEDSSIIEGSIYVNANTPGAGLSYQFVNPLGTTQAYVQYHKPYWDVVEAIVEDATRDRAAVWHLWRPDPKWSVRVDGGYNRYNIDGESGLADSVGVQATVLRTLWDKHPYVALAYGYDGEYMLGDIKRGGTAGSSYKLLPLRSREVHALSGIFYEDFTPDTNGELNLGYAVDRLGGHGPSMEARLTHYLTDEFDVQLRARYGLETNNTDNDALSVGGYARWTW
jgi:hypothetical protein